MSRLTQATALVVAMIASGHSVSAADDHFVTIFSAEAVPFESRKTHMFVVLHRVPAGGAVEQHHISWFPESRRVRGVTLRPEPGLNLPLDETFAHCRNQCLRVSVWGPYQIKPELFELMKCQQAKLESGKVKYKPTDNLYPSDVAANCYHAIWQPVAPCRKYSGAFNCGDASGAMTVQLFSKWIIDPCKTHDAVLELVVPKGETITRRSFDDRPGRIDAIRSAVGR
jgi:hypothetical protein